MNVKQIYTIINSVSSEVLGKTDIVQDDLTGIVDLGTAVFNQGAVDNYVKITCKPYRQGDFRKPTLCGQSAVRAYGCVGVWQRIGKNKC